jgi:hypothetical protein
VKISNFNRFIAKPVHHHNRNISKMSDSSSNDLNLSETEEEAVFESNENNEEENDEKKTLGILSDTEEINVKWSDLVSMH